MENLAPMPDEQLIHSVVYGFYDKVRADDMLGPIFNAVVEDWDEHLPRMCDFWSSVMRRTGRYKGNPMMVHIRLEGVTPGHFERWLALFNETVSALCEQPVAHAFMDRAQTIARSLQYGMFYRDGILG